MKHMNTGKNRQAPRVPPLSELFPSGETVVLYGDRRLTVQGCRKILAYSPSEIHLQLKHRRLLISGENLACSSFSGGCTTLQGKIFGIRYLPLEGKEVAGT